MKLADWIKRERKTRVEVAEYLGVSPPYITNLCSDEPCWPSRDVVARLIELTGGEVSAPDFLPTAPREDAAA